MPTIYLPSIPLCPLLFSIYGKGSLGSYFKYWALKIVSIIFNSRRILSGVVICKCSFLLTSTDKGGIDFFRMTSKLIINRNPSLYFIYPLEHQTLLDFLNLLTVL